MFRTFRERFVPAGILGAWLLTSVYTVNALIGLQAIQMPTFWGSTVEITAQPSTLASDK
jgi:hypothetical protein